MHLIKVQIKYCKILSYEPLAQALLLFKHKRQLFTARILLEKVLEH